MAKVKNFILDLIAPLIICVIALPNHAVQARPEASTLDSTSVMFWHFDDIEDYMHNDQPYFEISNKGKKFLWNPVNRTLTDWDNIDKAQLQKADFHSLGGGRPLILSQNTNLEWHDDSIATSFNDYYELVVDGQSIGSFYLIINRGKGYSTSRFCCGNRNHAIAIDTLEQRFDTTIAGISAVKLSTGLILLIVGAVNPTVNFSTTVSMYVIGLLTVPKESLAFDGNVFLIPRPLIQPALQAAGLSLRARYSVVKRFMANAKAIPKSNSGHYVKATQFFSEP